MPSPLKAVIFDFDGVIGDTFDINYSVSKTFHSDLTLQQFKDHHNGNPYEKPVIHFTENDIPIFFNRMKQQFTSGNFFPVIEIIPTLHMSYQLFVMSSNSDDNISHFLKLKNIDKYFKQILGVYTHKSKIKKFQMIFERYKMLPNECLYITDTIGDIIEARKANVQTIAVTWGYHDRKHLTQVSPYAIVDNEKELLDTIQKMHGKQLR